LNLKILEKLVMESLTNASKHSRAKYIQIKVEIRSKHIRFYYKDDGVGCSSIHEGLGIAGMRERILGAGGTIAMDGQDGFMIVCHLPITAEKEGEDRV
jgi:signal transduction histidine kinase